MATAQQIEELRTTAIAEAVDLFEGDEAAAERWLHQPLQAIGGAAPMDYMTTFETVQHVRDVIGRLERGIPN